MPTRMTHSCSVSLLVVGLLAVACGSDDASRDSDGSAGGGAMGGTAGTRGGEGGTAGGGEGGTTNAGGSAGEGAGGTTNPGAGGAGGAQAGDGGQGGGATRGYKLAASGTQLLVTGPNIGFQLTPANLADDVDVIEVHQEFYGVPWDDFTAGNAPPAAWAAAMKSIAAAAKATSKPVFLSVSMLNGERDSLAARTTVDAGGKVGSQDNWAGNCYDFAKAADGPARKQGYLRYVAWMLDTFAPAYLNFAIEVNLFFESCPAAVAGVIDVANAAYDAAKAAKPGLVAFPSIQIDHLYGYNNKTCPGATDLTACFDSSYATIVPLKRDRFAVSSYPPPEAAKNPADLPADWFTRAAARGGERLVVAETGWNSTPLVAELRDGTCYHVFDHTEADELAYLDRLLEGASSADVINWWSDRDLVIETLMSACPCTFDATWCAVDNVFRGPPTTSGTDTQFFGEVALKAFGAMGLRAYDGTPKPTVYARWQQARALPVVTR